MQELPPDDRARRLIPWLTLVYDGLSTPEIRVHVESRPETIVTLAEAVPHLRRHFGDRPYRLSLELIGCCDHCRHGKLWVDVDVDGMEISAVMAAEDGFDNAWWLSWGGRRDDVEFTTAHGWSESRRIWSDGG